MRKYVNKLTLSIALAVLSLLTMVATTYAWVGLLTNSTFDEFEINLEPKYGEVTEYGIQLSLDGVNFSESLNQVEIKRYLLNNYDSSMYSSYLQKNSNGDYIVNANRVEDEYRKIKLDQCTVDRTNLLGQLDTRLNKFTNMRGEYTTKLLQLDLFVSIFKIASSDDDLSDKKLDLYLNSPEIITSSSATNRTGIYSMNVFNSVTYPNAPGNYLGNPILSNPNVYNSIAAGTKIEGNVKVNIANTCRVAFEKFRAVDKGDISAAKVYDDEIFIYQTGSIYPTYDPYTGVYDFGSVLPDEYNFARQYFNTIYASDPLPSVPQKVLDRGDVVYNPNDEDNVHIVNQGDGVTTTKMVGFRIYFWFEGWDSDCFEVIDNKSVTLNISFSTKSPNEA